MKKIINLLLIIAMVLPMFLPTIVEAGLISDKSSGVGSPYGGDGGDNTPIVDTSNTGNGSNTLQSLSNQVFYSTYVEGNGWQDEVSRGLTSGTEGKGKRIEAIKIRFASSKYTGGIEYKVHMQDYGWQDATYDNSVAGKPGEGKRIEAIQINLTGNIAKDYDIEYRAHVQDYGWQDWVKNGTTAGTINRSLRLEAIQIRLTKKTFKEGKTSYKDNDLYYYDSYFSHPSTEYDSHLATLSVYMTEFSMILDAPNNENDNEWYNEQSNRIKGFFETIGFYSFMANEDYYSRTQFDTIGIAVASKKIGNDTVIAVVPRSGGYYREWSNNVWLGDGTKSDYMHEGWYNAANKLIKFLDKYVTENDITGNVKLWMAGYSRGGATTNIAAGLLDNKINKGEKIFSNGAKITHDNLYAYTFEAPQGANVYSKTVKAPTDKIYNNIFNIVNPNDLVTKVAMQEWGFTRFGIDKYIKTKFYDPENYGDYRNIYKALWTNVNHMKWENYSADTLTMYGIPGEKIASLLTPSGWVANGLGAYFEGLNGIAEIDTTKANYDSNIVSTLVIEELASKIGSREKYCKYYQQGVSDVLLQVMNDDEKKSSEYIETLIQSIIVYGIGANANDVENAKYNLKPVVPLINVVAQIYLEIPNEILSVAINIGNIFQNHEPVVTITHMEAQDSYYIDDYNNTHSDRVYLVPLHNNADMFRAEFFGFNNLVVWKGDNNTNWAEVALDINSPNKLINVEGFTFGKSEIHNAQPSCAVGYYSYITEEKMKLFCQVNNTYRIGMKSYSKKPVEHEVSYKAYYKRLRATGVTTLNAFGITNTIPNYAKLIDSYSDKVVFNSDNIVRTVSPYTSQLTGTAFGTGSIKIISIAGVVLFGTIIYSVIYKKKQQEERKKENKKKK